MVDNNVITVATVYMDRKKRRRVVLGFIAHILSMTTPRTRASRDERAASRVVLPIFPSINFQASFKEIFNIYSKIFFY